jgi:sortase (surface protein transpeptidase)
MKQPTQHGGHRGTLLAAAATVVLVLVAGVVITLGLRHQGPPQPAAAAAAPATPAPATPAPGPTRSGTGAGAAAPTTPRTPTAKAPVAPVDLGPIMRGSAPVRLDIPSIGVHTSTFVDLGRAADGSIEVPTDFAAAGFYTPGPTPGQLGPAVIAGHVDSHQGPAVFYRLGDLRAGARISVGRKDGSTATFVVDKVASYPKASFPTSEVYGNTTSRAELRLITCGGSFDDRSGHYVDNVVAFAHLVPAA